MHRTNRFKISFIFIFFAVLVPCCFSAEESSPVRTPEFAGSFYPENPVELQRLLHQFFSGLPDSAGEAARPVALVVPHAGYPFSGQIAAAAYQTVKGYEYDTAILIGPAHHVAVTGAAVWAEGTWQSPLGELSVDEELAEDLIDESPLITGDREPHSGEHSLEVQIPFLQTIVPGVKIVPLVINDASQSNCMRIAAAIASVLKKTDKRVLIVISTDFSHYAPLKETEERDALAFQAIENRDAFGLAKLIESGKSQLCGDAATLTFLEILKAYSGVRVKRDSFGTSAEVTGNNARVVGYGAFSFYGQLQSGNAGENLNEAQQKELLAIARKTLQTFFSGQKQDSEDISDPVLEKPAAVFVTLTKNGELRGCIGEVMPSKPLYQAVRDRTLAAALHDPRFEAVTLITFLNFSDFLQI